jgi:hypothetical protein
MYTLEQVIRRLEPALEGAAGQPIWACVFDSATCPACVADEDGGDEWDADPSDDFCVDLWTGSAFLSWWPPEAPQALVTALPVAGIDPPLLSGNGGRPRHRGRGRRPGAGGRLMPKPARGTIFCAVSEDGDAYAVVKLANGAEVYGVPTSGRVLDLVRSKLMLPPGPTSTNDLEMTSTA